MYKTEFQMDLFVHLKVPKWNEIGFGTVNDLNSIYQLSLVRSVQEGKSTKLFANRKRFQGFKESVTRVLWSSWIFMCHQRIFSLSTLISNRYLNVLVTPSFSSKSLVCVCRVFFHPYHIMENKHVFVQ